MKIHIFGASGSGVTTLGLTLSARLGIPYFDSDDYFWLKTDPPFTTRRDAEERNNLIVQDLSKQTGWILGGSIIQWGDIFPSFDLIVFLYVPAEIRMARLKAREWSRYGDELMTNETRKEQYEAFLNWAAGYEDPQQRGRTKQAHLQWLKGQSVRKLEIEGDTSVADRCARIISTLGLG